MVCQIHRNKEADNKDDATITVLGRRGLTCGGGWWLGTDATMEQGDKVNWIKLL